MAVKADDVLNATLQTQSLDAALAEATWIVGTTNRARPGQRILSPRELAAEALERGAPTLLFGDENSGLDNLELLRCHDVSTIATSPEQSSPTSRKQCCSTRMSFSLLLAVVARTSSKTWVP